MIRKTLILPCMATDPFIGHKSLGYFGISCVESSEANWWNRQYLLTVALQVIAWESQL